MGVMVSCSRTFGHVVYLSDSRNDSVLIYSCSPEDVSTNITCLRAASDKKTQVRLHYSACCMPFAIQTGIVMREVTQT